MYPIRNAPIQNPMILAILMPIFFLSILGSIAITFDEIHSSASDEFSDKSPSALDSSLRNPNR